MLQSDTADALMSPPPSPVDKRTGRASLFLNPSDTVENISRIRGYVL